MARIDKDRVVVEQVVTEEDFLGYVQAAPTRYIYPAKLKKARLERIYVANGDKPGEATLKVDGKDVKCRTVEGHVKGADGEKTSSKLWLCDDVPGTIVKQVRTARMKGDKGEVVAETTTTLRSYKKAE